MDESELPPLARRVCVQLTTYGRAPKLGPNVRKVGKGRRLDEILTARGWTVVKTTKDYFYAQPPPNASVTKNITLEIDVPTQEQVLAVAARVHAEAPERTWGRRWGELTAVYFPSRRYSTQSVDPFTGAQVGELRQGSISAYFDVGEPGVFTAAVVDVGGENRYSETPSSAAGDMGATLWESVSPSVPRAMAEDALLEGGAYEVRLTKYERNAAARQACIDHWGTRCCVCGFDFGAAYGELGTGYIQVHHLVRLADTEEEHAVDPVADLRPVCANCHAVIHRREPPLTIDELQDAMRKAE